MRAARRERPNTPADHWITPAIGDPMANRTRGGKSGDPTLRAASQQGVMPSSTGRWIMGQAVRGACSGAVRALTGWLIKMFVDR